MIKEVKENVIDREYTYEVQNFNLVQTIYLVGLLLLSGVIYVCIPDTFYLYLSIIMCFLILITIIDANRNGGILKCSCLISVVSNFFFLPLCFYGFGRLICCVPLYFILGILYTVLLIGGRLGAILSIAESIYLCLVIYFVGKKLPDFYTNPPTAIDYFAIIIGISIVVVLAALAIRTKVVQYDLEYKKLEKVHLDVTDAYNSKDIFFANTSHEIRTPLNAIVGTVNLLLDEDLEPQAKENVYNILNACNALLAITDELMELSNTEDMEVSISETKFDFSKMLSEIVNMMSVRLVESDVCLFVDINRNVPKYLNGDRSKIRQVYINILNNAVKYTKSGSITLKVRNDYNKTGDLYIKTEVIDTGIGIKDDIIPHLFKDYNRDEDEEKREIEGTGLGLSLCKEILEKMGGSISVTSAYHVGSTFTFSIPQQVGFKDPIASILNYNNTAAIIYEKNDELADALSKILTALKVESLIVSDRYEFEEKLLSGEYYYVFIAIENYLENQRFIDRKMSDHRMVIISNINQGIQIDKNCYMLTRPAHIINVAMAYNNESNAFSREIIQSGGFTCPETTILCVDDNNTNLEVLSGLLKKYEATIITAISGNDCLNVLENTNADIVFMDYMMPDMNGIDTLYKLREINSENAKNVPVVALTANVISGAREMFIEAGFCEYMTKPVDVKKLENTLKKYLPREQLRIKI